MGSLFFDTRIATLMSQHNPLIILLLYVGIAWYLIAVYVPPIICAIFGHRVYMKEEGKWLCSRCHKEKDFRRGE
jgi:hypothetical protein